jgi:hypothetical protein
LSAPDREGWQRPPPQGYAPRQRWAEHREGQQREEDQESLSRRLQRRRVEQQATQRDDGRRRGKGEAKAVWGCLRACRGMLVANRWALSHWVYLRVAALARPRLQSIGGRGCARATRHDAGRWVDCSGPSETCSRDRRRYLAQPHRAKARRAGLGDAAPQRCPRGGGYRLEEGVAPRPSPCARARPHHPALAGRAGRALAPPPPRSATRRVTARSRARRFLPRRDR